MIKNAREYQITKSQAAKFERALMLPPTKGADRGLLELERDALSAQLADLRAEVDEYEALESGARSLIEIEDLDELPKGLIKARIAAGLSQRELAGRLGLKEQQIQRYEATEYSSASLSRLLEVVRALGIKLRQDILLPNADVSPRTLIANLRAIGLDPKFVQERLILNAEENATNAWRSANAVGRIFRLSMADVVRGNFGVSGQTAFQAMYKLPARANKATLFAYTAYARFLAERTLTSVGQDRTAVLEAEPRTVFRILGKDYGGVTFAAALRFVWDRGLTVLPLRDSGTFHGAFWKIRGRGIIVLKQRTRSCDRWLIDLLHEYYHAVQTRELSDVEFMESDDSPFERRDSEEERTATAWAIAATLDGREQDLAQMCIDEADGHIPRLKKIVPRVASREGVAIGVLANYVAYKLSSFDQGNWWSTANALASDEPDPWQQALDALLENLDLRRLDSLDREILARALAGNGERT